MCGDLSVKENFREIPCIGFFEESFRFPVIYEEGREWMSVKTNEVETMRPAIEAVRGRVVVFGLGIGYFTFMVSEKDDVEEVTVVERDKDAVAIFRTYILPQFNHGRKVRIVIGDAFEYVRWQMAKEMYDYAFVDLWHDVSDGLGLYLKMKKMERVSPGTVYLYWIENSLLSAIRWQLFRQLVNDAGKTGMLSHGYRNDMPDRIEQWFSNDVLKRVAAGDPFE